MFPTNSPSRVVSRSRSRLAIFGLMLLLGALAVSALEAQRPKVRDRWVTLGSKNVTDALERDTISVSSRRSDFKALKLRVTKRPVQFRRLVVHFRNGGEQVHELNRVVEDGEFSPVIDLAGKDRKIEKIVMVYDAQSLSGKSARVTVLARR